jgi:outer membrane protein TolC
MPLAFARVHDLRQKVRAARCDLLPRVAVAVSYCRQRVGIGSLDVEVASVGPLRAVSETHGTTSP